MAFCADYEANYQVTRQRRRAWRHRLLSASPAKTFLLAHDLEHGWRCSGEWAIREEMERRVERWLSRKRKVA